MVLTITNIHHSIEQRVYLLVILHVISRYHNFQQVVDFPRYSHDNNTFLVCVCVCVCVWGGGGGGGHNTIG